MQTLQENRAVERTYYETSFKKLWEQLLSQKVPEDATIHYWYETKKSTNQIKEDNWKSQWMSVAGLWEDYDDVDEVFQDIRKSFDSRINVS